MSASRMLAMSFTLSYVYRRRGSAVMMTMPCCRRRMKS